MTVRAPLHPQGTRIRVRPGRLPMNPRLVGRTGTVVALDIYQPGKYGVVLDGDDDVVQLVEDELERLGA